MQLKNYLLMIPLVIAAAACDGVREDSNVDVREHEPLRFGMITGLKKEKADYYKKLHAEAWKGVLKTIEACNIRNYSIYLQEIDDKLYLFSYFEYIGDNFEEDMKKMAADSVTQQWWKETDPCQMPLPEAAAQRQIWLTMEEVFHTD